MPERVFEGRSYTPIRTLFPKREKPGIVPSFFIPIFFVITVAGSSPALSININGKVSSPHFPRHPVGCQIVPTRSRYTYSIQLSKLQYIRPDDGTPDNQPPYRLLDSPF